MIKFEMLSRDNIDEVYALEKVCFEDPWSFESFESELSNKISVYIVARDEETDKIVGYGGVWMMYDCGDITNIAVSPESRRMGLGEKILELLTNISREKGMESLGLEVRASNDAAIGLYEKCGFTPCGIRKRYYKGKEDAILMSKSLMEE